MFLNNTTLSIPRERARCIPILCKGLAIILLEGGGDEEFSSANNFFNICASAIIFFPKSPA